MRITANRSHALLAAAVLVGMPATAMAKDPVAAQANKVAAAAKDLQQASNKLDATIANTEDNASGNGAADTSGYDNDRHNANRHRHDDYGKWGLLGLLGLAGLLGLRRRDRDDRVYVDRRDELAGPTATRTDTSAGIGDASDTRL